MFHVSSPVKDALWDEIRCRQSGARGKRTRTTRRRRRASQQIRKNRAEEPSSALTGRTLCLNSSRSKSHPDKTRKKTLKRPNSGVVKIDQNLLFFDNDTESIEGESHDLCYVRVLSALESGLKRSRLNEYRLVFYCTVGEKRNMRVRRRSRRMRRRRRPSASRWCFRLGFSLIF